MKKITVFIIISITLTISLGAFFNRAALRDAVSSWQKPLLPKAQLYENFTEEQVPAPAQDDTAEEPARKQNDSPLPARMNLAVPFTSQAPHANWELPYQEACEEASLLMVARYKNGQAITSPEDADREILKLVDFQNSFLGYYKDTTAEETAEIAREYYGFTDTEVLYDFTVEDVKRAVARGNPVIIPAAGRMLGNPYFTSPGPLYHMLVIRGYTETHFITNDPGTRRGEEFIYKYDTVLNAAHDWNNGDVESGRRVMIVMK